MIKSKKQRFCCVETQRFDGVTLQAKSYYEAVRENESEYTISNEKEHVLIRLTREQLLGCGYLC